MQEDTQYEDVMKDVKFEMGKKFGEWKSGKELDSGEYGMVYLAMNKKGEVAALKAESNSLEGGSAIKLEAMVLRKLNENGPVAHIPEIYAVAKRSLYCYMVMTLLGPNLRSLYKNTEELSVAEKRTEKFSRGTWSRIGIQCLYALKFIHDHGFVHRHIKPRNFLLGLPNDPKRCRVVHIIDFGLSRQFAYYSERDKKWFARKPRKNVNFRGDWRYASPNVHENNEQGRVDDLWSLIYMLFEFDGNLPWKVPPFANKYSVKQLKKVFTMRVLLKCMPASMRTLGDDVLRANYYERPDYHKLFVALWKVMEEERVTPSSKYDWETNDPSENVPTAAWEDPTGAFFQSDPIGINSHKQAPSKEKTSSMSSYGCSKETLFLK